MDVEIERKRVLIVESASTELKQIIQNGVMLGQHKSTLKALTYALCDKVSNELKDLETEDKFISQVVLSLKQSFLLWYQQTIALLKKNAKKDKSGLLEQTLKSITSDVPLKVDTKGEGIVLTGDSGSVVGGEAKITNLRDYMTYYEEGGLGRYVDYGAMIKDSLVDISKGLADGTLSLTDSLGRRKSMRNMAEIKSRYDLITADLSRLKERGVEFVVATSHANASERCSWWQGKIFFVDLDVESRPFGEYKGGTPNQTILGYIDGKPYYSLKQACENGFLSYNCQHRLIKYYKGIKPIEYPMVQVNKARDLTIRQRQMENTIRHWKRKERLSDRVLKVNRTNPLTGEQEQFTEYEWNVLNSKLWQEKYRNFSRDNGLPIYEWRTRITEYESK